MLILRHWRQWTSQSGGHCRTRGWAPPMLQAKVYGWWQSAGSSRFLSLWAVTTAYPASWKKRPAGWLQRSNRLCLSNCEPQLYGSLWHLRWLTVCQRKIKWSMRCLRCVTLRDVLTVRLQQSTVCTCCVARQRLAVGKQTSWGAHLLGLGLTRSSHTACQSNPCLQHSWKEKERRKRKKNMQW